MDKQNEKSHKFPDLLQRVLKPATFSLTKNELKVNEYIAFWNFLKSSENIYTFQQEINRQISSMEQNKKLINKTYSIENLLSTLIAIMINNDIEKKKNQQENKSKNQNSSSNQGLQGLCLCPYSNPIITNFNILQTEQDENQFYQNLIGQICFLPDLSKQKFDSLSQDSRMTEYLNSYYMNLSNYTKMIKSENQPYYSVLLEDETLCKETGELSFSYQHLQMWIAKSNQIINRTIHDTVIKYYKALPHIAKDYPDEAEKSAICLLHLTKILFTFYGNQEIDSIRQVQLQVDIYRRWPYPVGTMAAELVAILNNEVKSPGSAFRFYVRNELPCVDFLEDQSEEQQYQQQKSPQQQQIIFLQQEKVCSKQNIEANKFHEQEDNKNGHDESEEKKEIKINEKSINRQGTSKQQSIIHSQQDTSIQSDLQYHAYIIYEQDQQEELDYILQYLDSQLKNNKINNTRLMRQCLIASMISIGLFAEKQERNHQGSKKDQCQENNLLDINVFDTLSKLSKKDLFILYSRALNIIEKCEELDSIYDIRLIQQNTLQELMREVIDNIQQGNIQYDNDNNEIQQPHLLFEAKNVQDSSKDMMNMYIPQFPLFKLYPFIIQSQVFSQNLYKQQSLIDSKLCPPKQFSQLIQKSFDDILKLNLPQHQQPLRYIIYGGDIELYNLLQELGQQFTNNYKLFEQLDYRVYLVPNKPLTLAKFIAYKDVWYQRYLYIPFREDILVPKYENCIEKSKMKFDIDNGKEKLLLPYELKVNAMLSYVREAQRTFKVRVYKIDCEWFNNDIEQQAIHIGQDKQKYQSNMLDNNTHQPKTIYFCQYVELGASVEAEIARLSAANKKDKSEQQSYYEMKEKGMIKFQYHTLTMITTCTDLLGNEYPPEQIDDQQIHCLKINNVYKDYFEGIVPIPNAPYVELSYITYENAKIYDQNLRQKNLFKKHSTEQLQSAFKALHTYMPCVKIEITESTNKPFKLLVDGKITNDLKKVVISPVLVEQDQEIQMNKNANKQQEQNQSQLAYLQLPIMTFLPLKI